MAQTFERTLAFDEGNGTAAGPCPDTLIAYATGVGVENNDSLKQNQRPDDPAVRRTDEGLSVGATIGQEWHLQASPIVETETGVEPEIIDLLGARQLEAAAQIAHLAPAGLVLR